MLRKVIINKGQTDGVPTLSLSAENAQIYQSIVGDAHQAVAVEGSSAYVNCPGPSWDPSVSGTSSALLPTNIISIVDDAHQAVAVEGSSAYVNCPGPSWDPSVSNISSVHFPTNIIGISVVPVAENPLEASSCATVSPSWTSVWTRSNDSTCATANNISETKFFAEGADKIVITIENGRIISSNIIKQRRVNNAKRICPECMKRLADLPRHMRNVHHWEPARASKVVNITLQRKNYEKQSTTTSKKRNYRIKKCNFPGCYSVVQRMSDHMRRFHAISNQIKPCCDVEIEQIDSQSITDENDISNLENNYNKTQNDAECNSTPNHTIEILALSDTVTHHTARTGSSTRALSQADQPVSVLLDCKLEQFGHWLAGPDGGRKNAVTVNKLIQQISTFRDEIKWTCTTDILTCSKLWSYVDSKVKIAEWKATTAKCYLGSLKFFLRFITREVTFKLTKEDIDLYSRIRDDDIPNWISSYRKTVGTEKHRRMQTEAALLLDKKKVDTILNSDMYKSAVKLLGVASSSKFALNPTREEYNLVKHVIFFKIHLRNPKRSGILAELTVGEYKKKMFDNESGKTTCTIANHKTVSTYGDSILVLTADELFWIDTYLEKLRPKDKLPAEGDKLFIKYNGSRHTCGDISYGLNNVSTAAGVGPLTATLMRKSAITAMYQDNPTQSSSMSVILDHAQSTGKEHYRCLEKVATSKQASDYSYSLFTKHCEGEQNTSPNEPNENEVPDSMEIYADVNREDSSSSDSAIPESRSSGKQILTDKELAIMMETGVKMIKGSYMINLRTIQELLPKALLDKYSPLTIMNRVRYERLRYRNRNLKYILNCQGE